jgi:hypothetical protein
MKDKSSSKLKLIKIIIFLVMVLTIVPVNQKADAHAVPLATDGVHINDVVTYMNSHQQSNFTHDDIYGLLNQITWKNWLPLAIVDSSLSLAGNVITVHFNQNISIVASDTMRISYDGGITYQPFGLMAQYTPIDNGFQLNLNYYLNYNIMGPIKIKILGGTIRDVAGRLYLQDIVTDTITPSIVVSPGSQDGSIDLKVDPTVDPTVVGTVYYKKFDYLSDTPTEAESIVNNRDDYFTASANQTAIITGLTKAHPYKIAVVIKNMDSLSEVISFTVLAGSLPIEKIQSYIDHELYYDHLTIADLKHVEGLNLVVIDGNFKVYQNMLYGMHVREITLTDPSILINQIISENEVAPINIALLTTGWYGGSVKLDAATLNRVLNINSVDESNFNNILDGLAEELFENNNGINLTKDQILGIIDNVINP